ncbi:hypothetical protein CH313_28855 [Streptomyces sp. TSRI0384-2]|nr:hypothetical protein CH313_28855 [Streptomyces sp. TSRI0384-2]
MLKFRTHRKLAEIEGTDVALLVTMLDLQPSMRTRGWPVMRLGWQRGLVSPAAHSTAQSSRRS